MLVDFDDDDYRHLFEDEDFRVARLGPELTEKYRRVLGFIVQAADERDLYAMKSLHYEKLGGGRTGQHSLRLNRQWRLIVRLEPRENQNTVVVVEIVDYH
jgi:proteic killer suppression protein